MLFDRLCRENGVRHLLTAPRSPTTTGKVERFHKTVRAEFLTGASSPRSRRPRPSSTPGSRTTTTSGPTRASAWWRRRALRARRRAPAPVAPLEEAEEEPALAAAADAPRERPGRSASRRPLPRRRLARRRGGRAQPARRPRRGHAPRRAHRRHARRRPPAKRGRRRPAPAAAAGAPRPRAPPGHGGAQGRPHRLRELRRHRLLVAGRLRGEQVEVRLVGDTVEISQDGMLLAHAARHDRAKEHGAFSTPQGDPTAATPPGTQGGSGTQLVEPKWNTGGGT